jgi:ELWxxDGT repeat protein
VETDGTDAGTVLIKDFDHPIPHDLTAFNGSLYFVGQDPDSGLSALWNSDGTDAGTLVIQDLNTYEGTLIPYGSMPYFDVRFEDLTSAGGLLYFVTGQSLWKSDGTSAGTVLVKEFSLGSSISGLISSNGNLFFTVQDANTAETGLWKTDGTEAGTVLVKDFQPLGSGWLSGNETVVNGTLFFAVSNGEQDLQLWKSNGTDAGTVLVKDFSSFSLATWTYRPINVNGTLFFTVFDLSQLNYQLWQSDGTETGTQLVEPNASFSSPEGMAAVDGNLFFVDIGTNGLNQSMQIWRAQSENASPITPVDLSQLDPKPVESGIHAYPLVISTGQHTLPPVTVVPPILPPVHLVPPSSPKNAPLPAQPKETAPPPTRGSSTDLSRAEPSLALSDLLVGSGIVGAGTSEGETVLSASSFSSSREAPHFDQSAAPSGQPTQALVRTPTGAGIAGDDDLTSADLDSFFALDPSNDLRALQRE